MTLKNWKTSGRFKTTSFLIITWTIRILLCAGRMIIFLFHRNTLMLRESLVQIGCVARQTNWRLMECQFERLLTKTIQKYICDPGGQTDPIVSFFFITCNEILSFSTFNNPVSTHSLNNLRYFLKSVTGSSAGSPIVSKYLSAVSFLVTFWSLYHYLHRSVYIDMKIFIFFFTPVHTLIHKSYFESLRFFLMKLILGNFSTQAPLILHRFDPFLWDIKFPNISWMFFQTSTDWSLMLPRHSTESEKT